MLKMKHRPTLGELVLVGFGLAGLVALIAAAGKKQLESMAKANGIEILVSEVYDKQATDLTDTLTKVKGAGVQAVVNWSMA